MGNYTEYMVDLVYEIDPYDDDYIEKLHEVARLFRSFSEAMDTFIIEHGYSGEITDADSKISFIKGKFEENKVPLPRNIKKWYTENKLIEKKTAFQICFAFRLSVSETEGFLRKICWMRGFDCHDREEVIYFYALYNGLSYSEAQDIICKVPKSELGKIDFDQEVLYTSMIVEEVLQFKNQDELVSFMHENIEQFSYNNATAYKHIRDIWEEISAANGLSMSEKNKLYKSFDEESEDKDPNDPDYQINVNHADKKLKNAKKNIKENDSLWQIYLQILGLAGNMTSKISTDRSLKPILCNNDLVHSFAENSFPNRDGLSKIINGVHVSDEQVRKVLILLVFYKSMVSLALKYMNYEIKGSDANRCRTRIDSLLIEAGYPELYEGNPFDWMIIYALNNDSPLIIYREYMQEIFYDKAENLMKKNEVESIE